MVIDCHTHLGRNEHIKATALELITSMDKAGIDQSLVFAGNINDCTNDWMMEQIAPYKDRLHGVVSVNLTDIAAQPGTVGFQIGDMTIPNMLYHLNHNAVALKLYTGYEHFAPSSDRVRQVLDMVKNYSDKRTIVFHTGDCLASITHAKLKYAQPLDIDDIAVDYPDFNFVIAHMGFPWQTTAAEVCSKNSNVYSDISGFVYGSFSYEDKIKFRKVITDFLSIASIDKLLFGTDWPIANQDSYIDALPHTMDLFLSPEMFTKHTVKVFNLK